MTAPAVEQRNRPKRRLFQALATVVMMATGIITASAAPAFAEPGHKCTAQTVSNVCLAFWQLDADHYRVHVGIDYRIPGPAARALLNQPGDPFRARIFGTHNWPVGNQPMWDMPFTLVAAGDEGLGGEWDIVMTRDQLNVDKFIWPFETDRLFARIDLYDNGRLTTSFDSPSFAQNF